WWFLMIAGTHCGGRARAATLDLKAIMNGVEVYRLENGSLPHELPDLVPRYLKELHADPWGHRYLYYRGPGSSWGSDAFSSRYTSTPFMIAFRSSVAARAR